MFQTYKSFLVCTGSTLALLATMPAFAAEQEAQAPVFEEITVTARRVEENLQRVPFAISAFSNEKLAQQDIKDVWTLTKQIPGVNICCQPGQAFATYVRGIGNGSPTYFADVPTDPNGFGNAFDLQSVQVLKGPQGTLFGLASNGGAFVFVPRKPGDTFGGYVEVSGGNYGRRTIEGAIDVPIVEDRVLFRMAALSFYRDGYITNIRNGQKLADYNYYILRPSLTLRITDSIENYTLFQYTKDRHRPQPAGVLSEFNFSSPAQVPILGVQALFNGGNQAAFDNLRAQAMITQRQLGVYKVNGFTSGCASPLGPINGPSFIPPSGEFTDVSCPFTWSRRDQLVNQTTWSFAENWQLKNIFGLAWSKSFNQPTSVSGAPLLIFDSGSPKNNTPTKGNDMWSNELQIHGKVGFVDFVAGYFANGTYSNPKVNYSLVFGNFESATISKTSSWDHSVYGQANVNLSQWIEGLSFTGGYRRSWDGVKSQTFNLDPTTLAVLGSVGGPTSPAGQARFSQGSYTAGFQYQYTPDTMFFVTNSKGYSSGGLQNVVGFETFSPDSLNNLEVGVKSTFDVAGVQARLNASYYHGWYSNVKNPVNALVTDSATGIQNLVVFTANAGKAIVEGVDADLTIAPTDWLEVGGAFNYTNDRYTSYPSINPITLQPIDLSSTHFLFTPEYKWTLRGTVKLPAPEEYGQFSITANYTHTGTIIIAPVPLLPTDPANRNTGLQCSIQRTAANGYPAVLADGSNVPIDCEPAYHNLDLSLDWRNVLNHEGLNASFIVTNVTKNIHADGQCGCYAPLGVLSYIPALPRMFQIQLHYSF
jgi:iron complex outermembrane receptor protein